MDNQEWHAWKLNWCRQGQCSSLGYGVRYTILDDQLGLEGPDAMPPANDSIPWSCLWGVESVDAMIDVAFLPHAAGF